MLKWKSLLLFWYFAVYYVSGLMLFLVIILKITINTSFFKFLSKVPWYPFENLL